MINRSLRQFFCALSMLIVLPANNYAGAALEPEQQAKDRLKNQLAFLGATTVAAAGLKTFVPAINHAWDLYAQSHPMAACCTIPGIFLLTGLGLSHDYQRTLNNATKSGSRHSPKPTINSVGVKYTALAMLSTYASQVLLSYGVRNALIDLQQLFVEYPEEAKWYTLGASVMALATLDAVRMKPQIWSFPTPEMTTKVTGLQPAADGFNVTFDKGVIMYCKLSNSMRERTIVVEPGSVLSPDNQFLAYVEKETIYIRELGKKTVEHLMESCSKITFTNDSKNLVALEPNEKILYLYDFNVENEKFCVLDCAKLPNDCEYSDILIGPDNSINICYMQNSKQKITTYRIIDERLVESPKNNYEFDEQDIIVPCIVNKQLGFAAATDTGIVRVVEAGPIFGKSSVPLKSNSLVLNGNQAFGVDNDGNVVSYLLSDDGILKGQRMHGMIADSNHTIQKATFCNNRYIVAYLANKEIKIAAFSAWR